MPIILNEKGATMQLKSISNNFTTTYPKRKRRQS